MNNAQLTSNVPLVSVIIPAYNAEIYLERTLNSVLSQTYKNLEVLVVDDGSSDQTAEIVRAMAQKDRRVILLQQANSGVAAARNLAIQNAKGELIAPIDADDLWYSQNIEKQVQCMLSAESSVGVVYAWSVDLDEDDRPTGEYRASKIEGDVLKILICHNFLGNSSASLIRRSCFETVEGYKSELKEQNIQGCEDLDFYLRLAQRYQFRVVPEFLIGYRQLKSSMSRDYTSMARHHQFILRSLQQNHPEIPVMLYRLSRSSLYLYFARQSSQSEQFNRSLFWLYKALKVDFITPLLRPSFYLLFLTSLFKIMAGLFNLLIKLNPDTFKRLKHQNKKQKTTLPQHFNALLFKVRFRLLVENLLNKLITIILVLSRFKQSSSSGGQATIYE